MANQSFNTSSSGPKMSYAVPQSKTPNMSYAGSNTPATKTSGFGPVNPALKAASIAASQGGNKQQVMQAYNSGGTTPTANTATNFSSQFSSPTTIAGGTYANNYQPTSSITPVDATNNTKPLPTGNTPSYDFNAVLKGIQDGSKSLVDLNNAAQQESTNTQSDISKMLTDLMDKQPNTEQIYQDALAKSGREAAQIAVNNKKAQLNQIVTHAQAAQMSLTGMGEGVPLAIIGGQQAEIAKEAAIQALPVQAELAAATDNLQMANDNLNTWFKIKSEDAQNKFQFKMKVADYAMQFATKDEERRISLIKEAYKERQDKTQETQKFALQLGMKLAENHQSIGILNKVDYNSPTAMQDLFKLAAPYLGTPLTESQKESSAINSTYARFNQIKGSDGKIDPNEYLKERALSKLTPSQFDDRFRNFINPQSYGVVGFSTANDPSALTPAKLSEGLTWLMNNKGSQEEIDLFKTNREFQSFILNKMN